jgi:hypothetical protein
VDFVIAHRSSPQNFAQSRIAHLVADNHHKSQWPPIGFPGLRAYSELGKCTPLLSKPSSPNHHFAASSSSSVLGTSYLRRASSHGKNVISQTNVSRNVQDLQRRRLDGRYIDVTHAGLTIIFLPE